MSQENDQKVSLISKLHEHYIKQSKINEIDSSFTQNKSKCAKPLKP